MRHLLALAIAFALVAAAACDDDAPSAPTPVPSTTVVPGSAEEIAFAEQVMLLVALADEPGLRALASGHMTPCETVHSGPGGGPVCHGDEAEGTPVESVATGICDGAAARLEDVRFIRTTASPQHVAYRPLTSTGAADYLVARFHGNEGDFYYTLQDGRITGVYDVCPTAAPLVAGRTVAAWILPPVYALFAGAGISEGAAASANDGEPLRWRFPSERADERCCNNLYWRDGMVFDCTGPGGFDGCGTEALADDALGLLSAPGTPVCVVGWTDDVGNVTGRQLYVGAERCDVRYPASGAPVIHAVIDAVMTQDRARFLDLIDWHDEGCIAQAQLSTPPQCAPGEAVGTPAEVVDVVYCDGGPVRRSDVEGRSVEIFPAVPLELYAVVRPADPRPDIPYRVVFSWPQQGTAFWLDMSEVGIVGIYGGCGTPLASVATGDYLVPPQFAAIDN